MKRWRSTIAVLCGLAASGCVAHGTPKSPTRTATAGPKRPLPKLECTFDAGDTKIYRTYLMAPDHLVEQGPARQRLHITSDDGETISAERLDRGAKAPTTVQIRLRDHEAVLTQAGADGAEGQKLPGTCAQAN